MKPIPVAVGALARVAAVSILALSATACGKGKKVVLDVALRTYEQAAQEHVELKALLNTGNLGFGASLPIVDPRQPGVVYGSVSLYPAMQPRASELTLDVNLTAAAQVGGVDPTTLPNGSAIPVGGLGDTHLLGLMAGERSKIYLGFRDKVAMVGVALVIPEFDQVAQYVPGVNLFPGFELPNGIWGTAGIFTGAAPLQSGIAVFVDAGSALDPLVSSLSKRSSALKFGATASASQERAVYRGLQRLDRRGERMSLR